MQTMNDDGYPPLVLLGEGLPELELCAISPMTELAETYLTGLSGAERLDVAAVRALLTDLVEIAIADALTCIAHLAPDGTRRS